MYIYFAKMITINQKEYAEEDQAKKQLLNISLGLVDIFYLCFYSLGVSYTSFSH